MSNWFVMQVNTGKENSTALQCRRVIPASLLDDAVVPTYSVMFRRQGQWSQRRHILFPGYVFLVTGAAEELIPYLKKIVGMTKLIGVGDWLTPITDSEEKIIKQLCGDAANAEVSCGFIEGDKITVTQGPLAGLESYIVKIDRHKRIAWLSLQLFGRDQQIQVGLEILRKS